MTNQEINKKIAGLLGPQGQGFCCPKCGSTWFGSNLTNETRSCHDEYHGRCEWSGPVEDAPPDYMCDDEATMELATGELRGWNIVIPTTPHGFWQVGKDGHYIGAATMGHAVCLAVIQKYERNQSNV